METVTATEAARHFSELLDRVERGETLVIVRGGRRVAVVGPTTRSPGRALKDVLRRHRADDTWLADVREVRDLLVDREDRWHDD